MVNVSAGAPEQHVSWLLLGQWHLPPCVVLEAAVVRKRIAQRAGEGVDHQPGAVESDFAVVTEGICNTTIPDADGRSCGVTTAPGVPDPELRHRPINHGLGGGCHGPGPTSSRPGSRRTAFGSSRCRSRSCRRSSLFTISLCSPFFVALALTAQAGGGVLSVIKLPFKVGFAVLEGFGLCGLRCLCVDRGVVRRVERTLRFRSGLLSGLGCGQR